MKIYEVRFITPGYTELDCVDTWISAGNTEDEAWDALRDFWRSQNIYKNVRSFMRVQITPSNNYRARDVFTKFEEL
jgi:hypothetical protein